MAASTVPQAPSPQYPIKSISFSTDNNFLLVAHSSGFDIFQLNPFTPTPCYSNRKLGGVQFAEQLGSTVLLALVGSGDQATFSPRTLKLFNSHFETSVSENGDFNAPTAIRRVKLNNKRLIVMLESRFYIYALEPQLQWRSPLREDTMYKNPNGVCAFSRHDNSLFAYPMIDKNQTEQHVVVVYDALTLHPKYSLVAHTSEIACLAFNRDATLLATASIKGTIIRVFDVQTKEKLYELRRGTYPAHITCIEFSSDSRLLACSSDHSSIHVFKLTEENKVSTSGKLDSISWWLPTSIRDALKPTIEQAQCVYSAKTFTLPFAGYNNILSFSQDDQTLYAATYYGNLYAFNIDIDNVSPGPHLPQHKMILVPPGELKDTPLQPPSAYHVPSGPVGIGAPSPGLIPSTSGTSPHGSSPHGFSSHSPTNAYYQPTAVTVASSPPTAYSAIGHPISLEDPYRGQVVQQSLVQPVPVPVPVHTSPTPAVHVPTSPSASLHAVSPPATAPIQLTPVVLSPIGPTQISITSGGQVPNAAPIPPVSL